MISELRRSIRMATTIRLIRMTTTIRLIRMAIIRLIRMTIPRRNIFFMNIFLSR